MSSDQQPELRPATPAAAGRTGFPTFWTHPATVVGAVGVILLIVTTLALLALRRDSSSAAPRGGDATNSTASPSGGSVSAPTVPMLPMSAAPPGGARQGGGGEGGPDAGGNQPDRPQRTGPGRDATTGPPRTQQAPRSGSLTLAHKGSTDLDGSDDKADVVVHRNNIGIRENGQFAVWSGSGVPSQAQCASAAGWVVSVAADQVSKGRSLCVRTTAGRSAVVKFTTVEKNPGGKLDSVTFNFTVWG